VTDPKQADPKQADPEPADPRKPTLNVSMPAEGEPAGGKPGGQLWGGRFAAGPSPELAALSRSPERYFDLLPYDVAGSLAHVRELRRAGILSGEELPRVEAALRDVDRAYRAGELRPSPGDEDVHTFVERELTARLGPLGGKVRAGRSRNDQAANNLRLYLRDQARRVHDALLDLIDALLAQARRHARTFAPGFTHLQPAQPVIFSHHLLAHVHGLARDAERLRDWDARAAVSPLGAAALAGSAIAVNPEASAADLGYERSYANSIDAVASRDHVAEFLFAASLAGTHLSQLAEEVCLWASDQFGWAALDDGYATGSSIMPQKRNPDIAEITRGKAARLAGHLAGHLALLKGLPLAYNRDLAEDKFAAMDAVDTLLLTLPAMAGMVATLRFDTERMRRDAAGRFTLATEVADWLALEGVPFAEAHEITGRLVRHCEDKGVDLPDLRPADLAAVDPRLAPELLPLLTLPSAVARRNGAGGTAPERVGQQLADLERALPAWRGWTAAYRGPRA
jgi:argininosuccinate lyase